MPETFTPLLPQNPRAEFMTKHRPDLELWTVIPACLGLIAAPLYDHLTTKGLIVILLAIVAINWFWIERLQPHIEKSVGVSRSDARASRKANKRPWSVTVPVWTTLFAAAAIVTYANWDRHYFPANGWFEKATGTWLCIAIVCCLYRAFDRTNYRPRRLWYGIAALVLTTAFNFLGTSPRSFAFILVLLGATGIVLGLLDLRLLFHFASTPADEQDALATPALNESDLHE